MARRPRSGSGPRPRSSSWVSPGRLPQQAAEAARVVEAQHPARRAALAVEREVDVVVRASPACRPAAPAGCRTCPGAAARCRRRCRAAGTWRGGGPRRCAARAAGRRPRPESASAGRAGAGCTATTRRPSTCGARPRRVVSTSGNSGMPSPCVAGPRPRKHRGAAMRLAQASLSREMRPPLDSPLSWGGTTRCKCRRVAGRRPAAGVRAGVRGRKGTGQGRRLPPAVARARTATARSSTSATMHGKVVIVTFWASWCGYCLKELPVLERIAGKGRGRLVAHRRRQRAGRDRGRTA